MTGPRFVLAVAVATCCLGLLIASSGTPPAGYSGAPGANNCRSCHGSFALNAGTASFFVTAPATVRAGQTVPVTVRFDNTTATRYGFTMTARNAANTAIGTWQITDTVGTQTISGGSEAAHKTASSQKTWTVNWVAPATLGTNEVTFYACGVEGNGSGSSGDYVYTTAAAVSALQLSLAVTSTSQSYSMTLSGGASLAGQEYQVLASTVPVPGPFIGLMPDPLFWALLSFPAGLPGIHANLDGAGAAAAGYPPGTLAGLAGVPLRFAAFTRTASGSLGGISNVVSLTP